MFIITIPVATHSVDIDLPQPTPNDNPPPIDPIKNKLVLTQQNEILWNAQPITMSELATNLQQSLTIDPEPELQFEPVAPPYRRLGAIVLG